MHGTLQKIQDDEERLRRRKAALQLRPDALDSANFVLALQDHEHRPSDITPDDIKRREIALRRADALAAIKPVRPNPAIEWRIETQPHSPDEGRSGWRHDEDGKAVRRGKRGPHERQMHDGDDDDDDGDCDYAPARKRIGRPRLDGLTGSMTPSDASARYRAKLLAAQEQQLRDQPPQMWKLKSEPKIAIEVCPFPLTVLAARKRDGSTWALGDALVIECSETSKTGGSRFGHSSISYETVYDKPGRSRVTGLVGAFVQASWVDCPA